MEDVKEFKLPSVKVADKKVEETANKTVLVQVKAPCWNVSTYYVSGQKFFCDKSVADELVAADCVTIIEG